MAVTNPRYVVHASVTYTERNVFAVYELPFESLERGVVAWLQEHEFMESEFILSDVRLEPAEWREGVTL